MDKRNIQSVIALALITLFVASCTQKTIFTTDRSHEENYYLSETDTARGSIYISLTIEIPVCYKDQAIVDSIRERILGFMMGGVYAKMDPDTVVERFATDLKSEYKANNEPLLKLMDDNNKITLYNEHVLEGFSLLSDENIFSYGMNRYVFQGGAHGLNTRNYFNFNLKNGKLITEADLFKPGTDSLLTELIKVRIVEERRENPELDPIVKLDDSDYWVEAIKPNGNFYITDQSINYVFNPYEIAPYYMGQTEVTLPFDRIKPFLIPNSLIDYLVYPKVAGQ
jgi:hypothetical protein